MVFVAVMMLVVVDPQVNTAPAADLTAAAPATPTAPVAKKEDPDSRIICKRLQRTGTRLAAKRYCATGFYWRQTAAGAQREMDDIKRRSQMEQVPVF